MSEQYQTLDISPRESTITQEVAQTNEGEYIETILSFKRLLNETDEISIHPDSANIFLYAIGAPTAPPQPLGATVQSIGPHIAQGSFSLDFSKATNEIYDSYGVGTQVGCVSDDSNYDYLVVYPEHKLKIYWSLDLGEQNTTDDFSQQSKVKMRMSHLGEGWLGLGVSKDSVGTMIGSEAVIGRPALTGADGEKPLKYELRSKYVAGIMPMLERKQTLMNASISSSGEEMTLTFTKFLEEENELPIQATGDTTFVFAVGYSDLLSMHKFKGSFQLDLSTCPIREETIDDNDDDPKKDIFKTDVSFKSSWAFHGVTGFIAFGLAMPFAVISVWLRSFLPTNWIYLHVYGNLIAFACTVIAVITAISTVNNADGHHFTEVHHILGLILLLFTSLQIWFGLFRPSRERGESNSNALSHWSTMTARVKWFVMHRFVGIVIFALGIFQVGDGLRMFAEDFATKDRSFAFSFFVTISAIVVGGLKVWSIINEEKNRLLESTSVDDLTLTPHPVIENESNPVTNSFVQTGLT